MENNIYVLSYIQAPIEKILTLDTTMAARECFGQIFPDIEIAESNWADEGKAFSVTVHQKPNSIVGRRELAKDEYLRHKRLNVRRASPAMIFLHSESDSVIPLVFRSEYV